MWAARHARLRAELETERARRKAEVARHVDSTEREWRVKLAEQLASAREQAERKAIEQVESAAREARELASGEWREHLARAVLLTREELTTPERSASSYSHQRYSSPQLGRQDAASTESRGAHSGTASPSQARLEALVEFGSAARIGLKRQAQAQAAGQTALNSAVSDYLQPQLASAVADYRQAQQRQAELMAELPGHGGRIRRETSGGAGRTRPWPPERGWRP